MSDLNQPPVIRQGRGCFFYGCLTCIILALIGGLAIFFTVRFVKSQITAYTDTAPMKLPTVEMADADYKELEKRVKEFGDASEQGKETPPLVLTERDLNALLIRSSHNGQLSNRVYVSLKGDQVKGQISIPLKEIPLMRDRYFNGEATFKVALTNGVLDVQPQEIYVKGKRLPGRIETRIQEVVQDISQKAANDPKNSDAVKKLESLQIQDGQVIIRARPATPPATPPAPN